MPRRSTGASSCASSLALTPTPCMSTPSKIITITTPLRPCSRQWAKEMHDDVKAALEEQSAALLRVVLQRRHVCPGEHALHEAVRQALLPAIRLLLHAKAEPNARCLSLERGCEFPLQLALAATNFQKSSDRVQVIQLLLAAGSKPNVQRSDREANTPLHDAARQGDPEAVRLLLRHKADPNSANGFGESPLELALRAGSGVEVFLGSSRGRADVRTVVQVLLAAGACPFAPPAATTGRRTLFAAAQNADPEIRAELHCWSAWWRCRMLAWIHSRSQDTFVTELSPEILSQVASYL